LNDDTANRSFRSNSSGLNRSKRTPCRADFIPTVIYAIYTSNCLWPAFTSKLRFSPDLRLSEYQQWAEIEEPRKGQFWNGLEMFLALPEY